MTVCVCVCFSVCTCVCKEREVDAWHGLNYHTSRSEGYRPASVSLTHACSSAAVDNGEICVEIHRSLCDLYDRLSLFLPVGGRWGGGVLELQ